MKKNYLMLACSARENQYMMKILADSESSI
jgi:hypothetical protein